MQMLFELVWFAGIVGVVMGFLWMGMWQWHARKPSVVIGMPRLRYNSFHLDGVTRAGTWSSERLLWASLEAGGASEAVRKRLRHLLADLREDLPADHPLVWGCKWHDGCMRWEVYLYAFHTRTGLARPTVSKTWNRVLATHGLPHLSEAQINLGRLLVQSIDVYPNEWGTSTHLYQRTGSAAQLEWPMRLPVMGECIEFASQGSSLVSRFVYADMQDLGARFDLMMHALGYTDATQRQQLINLLRTELPRYACTNACVHYKLHEGRPCFFMQYLGIRLEHFQTFLAHHAYPLALCDHVRTHAEQYADLSHEITIVYDIETQRVIRTAFYGATTFSDTHRTE
jgi:hypothetical protein